MTIEEAIYNRLTTGIETTWSETEQTWELVEEAWEYNDFKEITFPMRAPELFPTPYVIYKRNSTSRWKNLREHGSTFVVIFEFHIVSDSYSDCIAKREFIRERFEDKIGAYDIGAPYVQATDILSEVDEFNEKTDEYETVIEIEFTYNKEE